MSRFSTARLIGAPPGGPPGSGAPVDAQYLTLALNSNLTQERTLSPGTGLAGTDAGANASYTLDIDWVNLTGATAVAGDDILAMYDDSAGDYVGVTVTDLLGSTTNVNLYNADGTLQGNRVVTFDGNSLDFDFAGSSALRFENDGITKWQQVPLQAATPNNAGISLTALGNLTPTNTQIGLNVALTTLHSTSIAAQGASIVLQGGFSSSGAQMSGLSVGNTSQSTDTNPLLGSGNYGIVSSVFGTATAGHRTGLYNFATNSLGNCFGIVNAASTANSGDNYGIINSVNNTGAGDFVGEAVITSTTLPTLSESHLFYADNGSTSANLVTLNVNGTETWQWEEDGHLVSNVTVGTGKTITTLVNDNVFGFGAEGFAVQYASPTTGASFVFCGDGTNLGAGDHYTGIGYSNLSGNGLGLGIFRPDIVSFQAQSTSSSANVQFNMSSSGGTQIRGVGTGTGTTLAVTDSGNNNKLHVRDDGVVTINNVYSFPTADGNANDVLTTDGAGTLTFDDPMNLITVPGNDTEIIYNNSGAFAAESTFTYDYTNNFLTVNAVDFKSAGSATNSIAIGEDVVSGITTANIPNDSVIIGGDSANDASFSGSGNTVVGAAAGQTIQLGKSNTLLGFGTDVNDPGINNSVAIGVDTTTMASNHCSIGNSITALNVTTYGGFAFHRTNVGNGNYSVAVSDMIIGKASATSGGTVTLPDPTTLFAGQVIIIKDEDGNAASSNITIDTATAATIDGAASVTISTDYGYRAFYTDTANYYIIGSN